MDYQDLQHALLSKGKATEDRQSHHIFFFIEIDGKNYRATKFSHSARGQISAQLLSMISRQIRLTSKELQEFVNCTLGKEEWLKLWRQRS